MMDVTTQEFIFQIVPWALLAMWTLYTFYALFFRTSTKGSTGFNIIQSIPSIFVTLGVLGTFAGIAYGLINFDLSPDVLKVSIPGLLSGLKNAFFTSLYGLSASVLSNVVIQYQFSSGKLKDPEFEDNRAILKDIEKAINDFGKNLAMHNSEAIMSSLKNVIEDFNSTFTELIGELVTDNFDELNQSIEQLILWQEEYREGVNEVLDTNGVINDRTNDLLKSYNQMHNNMDRISGSATQLKKSLDDLRESIQDDEALSGLISNLHISTENLTSVTEDASVFKNEIERISNKLINTQDEIKGWLDREDGVRDAATSLNHTLTELRQFDIAQIEKLDQSFTNRLGETFQSLDKLMKSYIVHLENSNHN